MLEMLLFCLVCSFTSQAQLWPRLRITSQASFQTSLCLLPDPCGTLVCVCEGLMNIHENTGGIDTIILQFLQ